MSTIKLPAASGGGSISIKGPSSSGSDVDLLDTSGNINLLDGQKVRLGTSQDLQISHDGTDVEITCADKINIRTNDQVFISNTANNETMAKFIADGACELRYNDSAKLSTIDTGINITGGIRLGGNNAANQLEDYETGTFTPRMGGHSNIGTYNITGSGNYIKIGDICHVMIYFDNKDLDNSASGTAIIDQLPFTSVNTSIVAGITTNFHTYKVVFAQDQRYTFYVSGNTTSWKGLVSRNDETWANWDVADFENSNMYLEFHGSYRTA